MFIKTETLATSQSSKKALKKFTCYFTIHLITIFNAYLSKSISAITAINNWQLNKVKMQ